MRYIGWTMKQVIDPMPDVVFKDCTSVRLRDRLAVAYLSHRQVYGGGYYLHCFADVSPQCAWFTYLDRLVKTLPSGLDQHLRVLVDITHRVCCV